MSDRQPTVSAKGLLYRLARQLRRGGACLLVLLLLVLVLCLVAALGALGRAPRTSRHTARRVDAKLKPPLFKCKSRSGQQQQLPEERAHQACLSCSHLDRPLSDTTSRHNSPFLVDEQYDFTVCSHAKVASTYLMNYLFELHGTNISAFSGTDEVHAEGHPRFATGSSPALATLNLHYKFQTVRDPFQRFVSSYLDKVVDTDYFELRELYEFLKKFQGLPKFLKKNLPLTLYKENGESAVLDTGAQLDEYLKYYDVQAARRKKTPEYGKVASFAQFTQYALVNQGLIRCKGGPHCLKAADIHVQPQWVRCDPCALRYDAILKVENFTDEMRYIRETLKLPDLDDVIATNLKVREKRLAKEGKPERSEVTRREQKTDVREKEKAEPAEAGNAGPARPNASGRDARDYRALLAQLAPLERDLLFTAYRRDLQVFDYPPLRDFP